MATIKSYTDLQQSKKLAEILPLESADMYYDKGGLPSLIDKYVTHESIKNDKYHHLIPCWSLAALLGVLPKPKIYYSTDRNKRWYCECWDKIGNYIGYTKEGSPIDACVAIIEKLNKLKML